MDNSLRSLVIIGLGIWTFLGLEIAFFLPFIALRH